MEKLSYLDNRIEGHFGGLKSDISILRHKLKDEIEGVKSTLTRVEKSLESAWNVIADLQAESKSHADFRKTYQSSLDTVKSELAMASSQNAKLETEIDALKVRFLEEQECNCPWKLFPAGKSTLHERTRTRRWKLCEYYLRYHRKQAKYGCWESSIPCNS